MSCLDHSPFQLSQIEIKYDRRRKAIAIRTKSGSCYQALKPLIKISVNSGQLYLAETKEKPVETKQIELSSIWFSKVLEPGDDQPHISVIGTEDLNDIGRIFLVKLEKHPIYLRYDGKKRNLELYIKA